MVVSNTNLILSIVFFLIGVLLFIAGLIILFSTKPPFGISMIIILIGILSLLTGIIVVSLWRDEKRKDVELIYVDDKITSTTGETGGVTGTGTEGTTRETKGLDESNKYRGIQTRESITQTIYSDRELDEVNELIEVKSLSGLE